VDVFAANVERRRDGQMVGVLYRNGARVEVRPAGTTPNDPLCAIEQTPNDGQPAAVQHRRDRDPVAVEQTRFSADDLLIHAPPSADARSDCPRHPDHGASQPRR